MLKKEWPKTAMPVDEAKAILGAAQKMGPLTGDDYERTLHARCIEACLRRGACRMRTALQTASGHACQTRSVDASANEAFAA